jgi:hypothetical protein
MRSLAVVIEEMKYRTIGMLFPGGTDLTVAVCGLVSIRQHNKENCITKSISHRLNFIVYRYMFRSSWEHHQAVDIINTIKLIEISI